jgi:MFS transporter, ACS family, DAL5 transporter family protein
MVTEINTSPEISHDNQKRSSDKVVDTEKVEIERMETGGYIGKDHTDFTQVDGEVAKYTSEVRVVIDAATNKRLRKLIDRRVLAVMIFTYFLQALDKGTLSFASIMGIQKDAHLVGQQVYIYPVISLILLLTWCSILG